MPPENEPFFWPPFLSNLIGFVCDNIAREIIQDPSLITSISAHKRYSEEPRTELAFTRVDLMGRFLREEEEEEECL